MSYGVNNANAPLEGRNLTLGPPLPARDAAIRQAPRYACAREVSNVRAPECPRARGRAREQPHLFCEELRAGFRTPLQIVEQSMCACVSAPVGDNVVDGRDRVSGEAQSRRA